MNLYMKLTFNENVGTLISFSSFKSYYCLTFSFPYVCNVFCLDFAFIYFFILPFDFGFWMGEWQLSPMFRIILFTYGFILFLFLDFVFSVNNILGLNLVKSKFIDFIKLHFSKTSKDKPSILFIALNSKLKTILLIQLFRIE